MQVRDMQVRLRRIVEPDQVEGKKGRAPHDESPFP
jgi:hypothetical protein